MRLHHKLSTALALGLSLGILLVLGSCTAASAASSPATPTPYYVDMGLLPVLTWHREGGIAGFCDDLTVNPDGSYVAETCKGGAFEAPLTVEQQAQLDDWVARLQSFEVTQTDPAVADAMTIKVTFVGQGTEAASEAERQAIQAFAAEVYTAALHPDVSVTPTPETVSPVRGEDRAYDAARDALMERIGVALADIQRVDVSSREWSDACLGLGGPAEACLTVITPGYRVVMAANGAQYAARTNADGSVVRFESDRPVAPVSGTVPWDDAVALVLDGRATQVFQTHALTVTLYLDDGSKVTTVEPAIDDIFDVVARCGDPCSNIILATE